jgi:hypothetical protein
MAEDSVGPIRQMLGETHATVTQLLVAISNMRDDSIRQQDTLDRELRTIKHDGRNFEQVIGGRLEMADRRSGELERRLGEVERLVKDATVQIAKATAPIEQLMEFRNRLAWGGVLLAGAVTLIWVFVAPVYSNLISRIFPP